MPVKDVPTLGWTRKSVAATILLVTEEQRRGIAARIAERMAELGLTNEKLAQNANVSVKTVSRLLNARHEPRGNTIEKVARALNYSEDELRGPRPAPLGLGAVTQLDRIEEAVEQRFAAIEEQQEQILERLDALSGQASTLTDLERETLAEVSRALNRLGRDVGRGRPLQRSGPVIPEAGGGHAA